MGAIGPEKLILLVLVVLLLFGAKRIPEIGASLGKGLREFKGSFSDTEGAARISERDVPAERPRDARESAGRLSDDDDRGAEPRRLIP